MKLMALSPFLRGLSLGTKIGAIDFGAKRIGVAISDEARSFAFPLTSIDRPHIGVHRMSSESVSMLLETIHSLCRENQINALVIGFPAHKDNILTPLCKEILKVLTMGAKLYHVVDFCNR